MGLEKGPEESCTITCNDPYNKGCKQCFGPIYGESMILDMAKTLGWGLPNGGKKAYCPKCMGLIPPAG